jgi:hypothetical protein
MADSGDLQFYVKSVSLSNLFPNGSSSVGINWQTSEAQTVKNNIEQAGESILGQTPEYTIKLTPSCMAKIREYNNEVNNESGLGFADYSLKANSDLTSDDSEFLEKLTGMGCVYTKGE